MVRDSFISMANTLRKAERLNKKKIIERLFAPGSHSFSVFPLRVVYLPIENTESTVSILISVSKRRFKRAVKRNRIKRQIREAYRKNKHELQTLLEGKQSQMAVAFLYLSDQIIESKKIEDKVRIALSRITENINATSPVLRRAKEESAPDQESAGME